MADDGGIVMNAEQFQTRLSSFVTQWKADKRTSDGVFEGVGSIVIPVGKASDSAYTKTAAFQMWLFGYEFPSVLTILTPDAFHIVATKKKAKHLEKLVGGKIPVEIYVRAKDTAENEKQFATLIDLVKAGGEKVGLLTKEPPEGALPDEWKAYWDKNKGDVTEVDIANAISFAALAVKDENELRSIRDASRATGRVSKYFVDEMSKILDEEKKITHQKFAEKISDVIENDRFWTNQKLPKGFDVSSLDWALTPSIQSGGDYDLKFGSDSDQKNLHAGVIIAGLGMRYNTYSSFIARTYMVDPTKAQEANYKLLLSVHDSVIKSIKDGVSAKDVYAKALSLVKTKKSDLADKFVKSVGYSVGIETRDSTLLLNAKSARTLKDGMTLVVTTGFTNLDNASAEDKRGKTYSLVLADTIRVTGADAAVFSKDVTSELDDVSFFFKDEQEPTPKKNIAHRDARIGGVAKQNIQSTRLRKERQGNHDPEKEAKLRDHQRELHDRRQKQGLQRYAKSKGATNGADEKRFKTFESYKRDEQIPTRVKDLGICLDTKASTVILPIMGRPVPFHINTIKNASSTSEGEFTSLRINFLSPGQGVGRKDDLPFEDANAQFVRSLTFRSVDARRMENLSQQITEMKKESVRKEQEKKQMEDVVEQDKLVIDRRGAKLDMVFLRPTMDTKRIPGLIEIHQNGVRYVHGGPNSSHIDVLFNNVKHIFFQPTKGEMIVLIHFHLHNPIMIGKRKTKDVQFFREATDMQFDETGNRKRKHRYGDEDEFEQEQEEKRRRQELDKLFKSFARKVEDAAGTDDLRVDVPTRDLGFHGVPSRSNVLVQPTSDALVQLTEPPFLVVTLDDIEIVHLERVTFGLKNFDMVIVFKDFGRPVQHVNTIPVESLDAVKEWLDSCEIPFYQGTLNLQWTTIIKTVQADPHDFFEQGGWNFLSTDSDDEDEDEESEESAFEMDEDDFGSEPSSDDESDFDENASQEADEDDMSEVSEAPSWDELEASAAAKDRNGDLQDDEPRKKSGKSSKSAPKSRKR